MDWVDDDDEFHVILSDGSTTTEVDFIWLATSCENIIDRHPLLSNLRETLPIDVINGMPALSQDLIWSRSSSSSEAVDNDGDEDEVEDECKLKHLARKRLLYCVEALVGLQLGADALILFGARHGAIKVAKAIRCDMNVSDDDAHSYLLHVHVHVLNHLMPSYYLRFFILKITKTCLPVSGVVLVLFCNAEHSCTASLSSSMLQ